MPEKKIFRLLVTFLNRCVDLQDLLLMLIGNFCFVFVDSICMQHLRVSVIVQRILLKLELLQNSSAPGLLSLLELGLEHHVTLLICSLDLFRFVLIMLMS